MENRCSIVLDLGTSSVKYGMVTGTNRVLFHGALPIRFTASRTSWETDVEVLFDETINVLSEMVEKAAGEGYTSDVVLITSQANTFVAVDKSIRPLTPGIVWIDARAQAEAVQLKKEFPDFREWSGIFEVRPTHYIAKLLWLKNNMPGIAAGSLCFPLINEYFALKLTGKYFSDYSNRGMSGMVDIHRLTVPEKVVNFLGLDKFSQPELIPSCGKAYPIKPEPAERIGILRGSRVLLAGNDQSSSAVGGGVTGPETLSVTFGTAQTFYTLVEKIPTSLTAAMSRGEVFGRSPLDPFFFHIKFEENCGLMLERIKESRFPDISYDELFESYRRNQVKSEQYYIDFDKSIDLYDLNDLNDNTDIDIESVIDYIISVFFANLRLFEAAHPIQKIVISGGLSQSPVWGEILTEISGRTIIGAEDRLGALVGAARIYKHHYPKA